MTEEMTKELTPIIPESTTSEPATSEPAAPRVNRSQLGWGVAIMTVGVLLALDRLEFLDVGAAWRHLPWILVAFGAAGLARGKSARKREDSWWLLGIGIYLLVNLWEVGDFWWGNSWPLILVLIGLIKLVDPVKAKDRTASFLFLGLGAFFLLAQGLFFGLDFEDAWPVLLIVLGGAVTWSALAKGGRPSKGGAS